MKLLSGTLTATEARGGEEGGGGGVGGGLEAARLLLEAEGPAHGRESVLVLRQGHIDT